MFGKQTKFIAMVLVAMAAVCGCTSSDSDPCLDACEELNDQSDEARSACEDACLDPGQTPQAASYCIDNPQACMNKAAD